MHTTHRRSRFTRLLLLTLVCAPVLGWSTLTTRAAARTHVPALALSTTVRDTFNRADGGVGSNWVGATDTSFYTIVSKRLDVQRGGPLLWKNSFGTTQDAFITLQTIDQQSPVQGLLLKVQPGAVPDTGAIAVLYDAQLKTVRVATMQPGATSWASYPSRAARFSKGDQLGARALGNGRVEIYQNGNVLSSVALNAADTSFFGGKGGRIGVWMLSAHTAVLDNFGGGTVAETPTTTPTNTPVPTTTPTRTPPADGLIDTTIVGGADPNSLCAGTITFNVSVQAAHLGDPQPTGTFYLQTASTVQPSGKGREQQTSASFTLPVGSAPETLHVRILFVPFVARNIDFTSRTHYPSPFRSSQIVYEITLPGGSGCANVTLTQSANLVTTYIQGWPPYIDLACEDAWAMTVQAFTVPVSEPPSGTFFFDCAAACPFIFTVPDWYIIHAVGTAAPAASPGLFNPGEYHIDITFIPDDPNQLPMRLSYDVVIQQSSSCPTDVPNYTNGPPPTSTP